MVLAEPEQNMEVEYCPAMEADGDGETTKVDIHSASNQHYKSLTPSQTASTEKVGKSLILFERAAKTWWDPKFDSEILENQYRESSFCQHRKQFRCALGYILFLCVAWAVFFRLMGHPNWVMFVAGSSALLLITLLILIFTFTPFYQHFVTLTSVLLVLLLCGSCLMIFFYDDPAMSAVGTFTGTVEILLLIYTFIPLQLYMCVILGVLNSVAYEVLSVVLVSNEHLHYTIGRMLLHIALHVMGIHIFIMAQVRSRSTFLKVSQSVMLRKDLEKEKQLKKKMIHSLMPPKVAEEVMRSREEQEDDDGRHSTSNAKLGGQLKFRSFHMSQMDSVTILFADIVGFTKMSSNKTAEHLVSLLNDLFGRFDVICAKCGCEKISTLGDCYYSVSGCPEPRQDHARCSVEMGLSMCTAIQEFDRDHNEAVNMRVGVHTGTVLCGIVGTRRFKFDVWSHDVTLANTMESDGKPGMVHISNGTYKFIEDEYEVEPGNDVEDIRKHKVLIEHYNTTTQQFVVQHIRDEDTIKTWFITGRKKKKVSPDGSTEPADEAVVENDVQPPVAADSINISMTSGSKEDGQPDTNGVSPTAQQETTETQSASAEQLDTESEANTALMQQLGEQHIQTDRQLMQCIREDRHIKYLHHPPINRCSLNFIDPAFERQYRSQLSADDQDTVRSLARPRFSTFSDLIVSFTFLVMISICCFLGFTLQTPWVIFVFLAFILESLLLSPALLDVCFGSSLSPTLRRLVIFFSNWYTRHIFGAIVASLPAVAVYSNFSCHMFETVPECDLFYCILLLTSLVHYCNFTMLNSLMKSVLASIAGLVLLIFLVTDICHFTGGVSSVSDITLMTASSVLVGNMTTASPSSRIMFSGNEQLRYEIILNVVLLLFLIWFLNREFEISYRLSLHGNMQAQKDRENMQMEKEQADWLLHNIIPEHVSNILKKTSKYCKNHKDVGVLFAKVINYDDFYDESFEGGREYLRVLNELMGDFEDLFDIPRYKDVEKIKTIGSCLMASSGLNPETRKRNKDPNAHLYHLMDFASDLLKKLEQFNAEIFNFDFEMAIGYNFGDVTSGVIGTTKLLYDIWGDTVNISSRMYSTGLAGKIQVTEDTANKLSEKFEFEYRGQIFVKGKGDMKTYILVKKKDGATWE